MKKFKKSYIALLGGILALSGIGVSLGSTSNVTPVKAAEGDVYRLVTSTDELVAGDKYIIVSLAANTIMANQTTDSLGTRCSVQIPSGSINTSNGVTEITLFSSFTGSGDEIAIFTLGGSDDAWTFYQESSESLSTAEASVGYLSSSRIGDFTLYTSSTEFTWGINLTDETWAINDGSYTIVYNNSFFACVAASHVLNYYSVQLFKEVDSYLLEARDWAQKFIDGLVCDETGVNAPDSYTWNMLGVDYTTNLSSEAKAYFANGAEGQDTTIDKAIKKYDYVINKYGGTDSEFKNFINREPTTIESASIVESPITNMDYITIIAITISVVALTSIVAFIIIYKRKRSLSK